jgi:hypothetical protein
MADPKDDRPRVAGKRKTPQVSKIEIDIEAMVVAAIAAVVAKPSKKQRQRIFSVKR